MKLTRTFHPVVQGAFYSEQINCGDKNFCKNLEKTIIKKLWGKLHKYCLCVLSYPSEGTSVKHFSHMLFCCNQIHCPCFCNNSNILPACLYLGDCNITTNHKNYYKNKLPIIGTVQVPHHGSKHNHDKKLYKFLSKSYFAVCSFGLGNKYHHPDKNVVQDICSLNKCFISVTQCPFSKYKQNFELSNNSTNSSSSV